MSRPERPGTVGAQLVALIFLARGEAPMLKPVDARENAQRIGKTSRVYVI